MQFLIAPKQTGDGRSVCLDPGGQALTRKPMQPEILALKARINQKLRDHMRKVNQEATAVIQALAQMAKGNDGYIKIQSSKTYMPVSVEVLTGQFGRWEALSVAHYYTQNGDLMADPEIVYVWDPKRPEYIYPYSWTIHGLGIYREYIEFENGEPARFYRKGQKNTAVFTGVWMENILQQQGLRVNSETVKSF